MMRHHVLSPGVLGLETNLKRFNWSFGIHAPESPREAFDACRVRMRVTVAPTDAAFVSGDEGKYHYFRAQPGMDSIRYERPFVYPGRLQLEAGGLLRGAPYIQANPTYHRYVTHRFMNLHSAGYLLTDMAGLALLRNGLAPLHCSAFATQAATVAVFAPPNTGKTLTTMTACIEHGASFLAEDLAITDGTTLHSVPWTSTFRYYGEIDKRPLSRLGSRLTGLMPFLELVPRGRPECIERYVPRERILDASPITHVAVLERGKAGVERVDASTMLRKLMNLNAYEFNYRRSPLNVAYEFFNADVDIEGAVCEERRILERMVTNAKENLVVSTPVATEYAPMLLKEVG